MNVILDSITWTKYKCMSSKNDVEKITDLLDVYERWIEEHKEKEHEHDQHFCRI